MIITRDYCEDDLNEVNAILEEAFKIRKKNFDFPEFHEIVTSVDNKVCGYLLMTKVLNPIKNRYYYLIDYVCVDEEKRGMGIGKKLLDYAEDYARSNNAIYTQLTCSTFRTSAHKLYEKCGYIKRDSILYRKELE